MASGQNYMYEGKIRCESALASQKIASLERSRVARVYNRVLRYREERSRERWRRGFMKLSESADRIGLGSYASMDRMTEGILPLATSGKKIELPDAVTVANVDML